jgi:hypothetical protein
VIATSFATVMQAALIPVAESVDTDFKPAVRATRWSTGTVVGRLGGNQDLPALRDLLTEVAGNATSSLSSARPTRPGRGE